MDFITKRKNTAYTDVSISVVGKKRITVNITIRNDVEDKISRTGYMSVAIVKDRLYFREDDESLGFKLSKSSKSSVNTQIYNDSLIEWAKTHEGDYRLEYDKVEKLYYVNAE